MKLVEQLTLVTLQTAHHGSTSPRIASTQRNHASRPVSTDFCNKIGAKRTYAMTSAVGEIERNGKNPSTSDRNRNRVAYHRSDACRCVEAQDGIVLTTPRD